MSSLGLFTQSPDLTMGVELELQIVNTHDYNLVPQAEDILRYFEGQKHSWDIKPEITSSMIEVSTSVHHHYDTLIGELRDMRNCVAEAARFLNLGIAGGGTHPFQHWSEQRIFDTPRFNYLHEMYGYLAKQFTVFGQHIHIGCSSGDLALQMLHSLSRYIPHFIALSASSPLIQGCDTGFNSTRMNFIAAFPLSGRAPFATTWEEFDLFFHNMTETGIVDTIHDFYWDFRPKAEFGTIELRICDTPMTVERAAALAVYLQSLARYWMIEQPFQPKEDDYLVYTLNRFQACRFGLEGVYIDPKTKKRRRLGDEIIDTLSKIEDHAIALKAEEGIQHIQHIVSEGNDANWIRKQIQKEGHSISSLMHEVTQCWMTSDTASS